MKILSPAKINLMLRILGQRDDGYHLLQTYFQLLDWGDGMQFTSTQENTIQILGEFNGLPQQDNLIYKAAQLLEPFKKTASGIEIQVDKKIPQGSGLGGGSSNAGTTLRVLNKLWQCDLSQDRLQKLAIQLGADVPIFVLNQSVMATGVGEKFETIDVKEYYYVLIFPPISITTKDVFSNKQLKRNQQEISSKKIHCRTSWTNACLEVVLDNYPIVKNIYNHASKYTTIYMSGTGSTLFACFENKTQANDFMNACPQDWKSLICKSK